MTPDPFTLVWQQYGWLGFVGYVMVREVWPFVRDRVWPERVKQARTERERLNRLEERQVEAFEAIGKSVQDMSTAIVLNNERLSTLIASHSLHVRETTEAITLIRERVGTSLARKRNTV